MRGLSDWFRGTLGSFAFVEMRRNLSFRKGCGVRTSSGIWLRCTWESLKSCSGSVFSLMEVVGSAQTMEFLCLVFQAQLYP